MKNVSKKLTYSGNGQVQVSKDAFSFNHKPGSQSNVKHRYSSSSVVVGDIHSDSPPLPHIFSSRLPQASSVNLVGKEATLRTVQSSSPTQTISLVQPLNYQPLSPIFSQSSLSAHPLYSLRNAQDSHSLSSGSIVSTWAEGQQLTHKNWKQYSSNLYQSSPRKPKPPGILNTGNICFLNSSVQCLAAVEGFLPILTNSEGNEEYTAFIVSLRQLLEQTHNWQLHSINPSALMESVSKHAPYLVSSKKSGKYQSQQDAGEFLLWVLDTLHMAYKKSKNNEESNNEVDDSTKDELPQLLTDKQDCINEIMKVNSTEVSANRDLFFKLSDIDIRILNIRDMSPIYQLFCGQLLEARECLQCRTMSVNLEYHTVLPLPVPDCKVVASLTDCFALFGEVENLSSDNNMLLCSFCSQNRQANNAPGLTCGKRLALFSTLPRQLIILLSRFSYDSTKETTMKKQSPIHFPVVDLNLTPFTMEFKLGSTQCPHQYLYDLTGFCVHTGAQSTSHGHYIAYSKVKDGSWYQFNDDYVTLIEDIGVEIMSPFVSKNAYILFYTFK